MRIHFTKDCNFSTGEYWRIDFWINQDDVGRGSFLLMVNYITEACEIYLKNNFESFYTHPQFITKNPDGQYFFFSFDDPADDSYFTFLTANGLELDII